MAQLPAGPRVAADTIDIADVARTFRRQWRAVLICVALGFAGAAAIVLFAPRRFDGRATVLARMGSSGPGSFAGRVGGIGEMLGGLGGLSFGSSIETELQMLRSRELAGKVIDSLQLQIGVMEPAGVAPTRIVTHSALDGSFSQRKLDVRRSANGTYIADDGVTTHELRPGFAGSIGVGTITLASGLPEAFTIRVYDREDAIDRFARRLTSTKASGDMAKLTLRADDSVTAASATNALVKLYLEQRKTTDRGVNARRVEYVTRQLDSVGADLTRTERELRRYQEATRIMDATVVGQAEAEALPILRRQLTDLQVDEAAIRQLLAQADGGRLTSRDLAAYPSFLRGSSVGPLVNQLTELEAQRIRLLERRTERDPEVKSLDETMKLVEANILGMARSYANAVTRQREQFQSRMDSVNNGLRSLPAAAERGGRLARDVERLTVIYGALEAQLIEARLGAIGEGGEARQIDFAVPPRKPAFPNPVLTMGIGTAGGLLAGMLAALLLGWFGRWLRDPIEIERAMGVTAQRIDADAPLFLAETPGARSLLVVPLDARARAGAGLVAERLARTARQRALRATVVDLSMPNGNGTAQALPDSAAALDQLEQGSGIAIAQLGELWSDETVAVLRSTRPVLLVAPPGPVDRTRLGQALDTLRRLDVPCAGVVISDGPRLTASVRAAKIPS